jgi:hypothetical protein
MLHERNLYLQLIKHLHLSYLKVPCLKVLSSVLVRSLLTDQGNFLPHYSQFIIRNHAPIRYYLTYAVNRTSFNKQNSIPVSCLDRKKASLWRSHSASLMLSRCPARGLHLNSTDLDSGSLASANLLSRRSSEHVHIRDT